MYSSWYYQSKINECDAIISKITGILAYFDDCTNAINSALNKGDGLLINNQAIDKGTLDKANSQLNSDYQKLQQIIIECQEKRENFQSLKYQAISRENLLKISDNALL